MDRQPTLRYQAANPDTPIQYAWGPTQDERMAASPPPAGPTNFWQRIQLSGMSALSALESVGKGVVQSVTQGVEDIGKQAIKQVKYLAGPTATAQQRNQILQNQQKASQTKLSPQTQSLLKQSSPQGRLQANKMIAQGASESQIQDFLNKDIAATNKQNLKAAGTFVNLASLAVGGSEAKAGAEAGIRAAETGAKAVADRAVTTGAKTALAGAIQGGASQVESTGQLNKDTLESAAEGALSGAALGIGASVAGAGARKLISALSGRALNRSEAAAAQSLAKEAIHVPVTDESTPTMVTVNRPNAPKLLGPGKGVAHGDTFTMSTASDAQKVQLSKRLTTINAQLDRTAQGKIALHPDEVKALIAERNNITKIAHGELKYEDVYGNKGSSAQAALPTPKQQTIPVKDLKLGSDALGPVDKQQVAKYKAMLDQGKTPEPIIVSKEKGGNYVVDGKHRLLAYKQAGIDDIPYTLKASRAVARPSVPKLNLKGSRTATSQLSAKVNARAIENKLTEDLGTSEHVVMDVKEQAQKAADLANTDPQKAVDVALGKRNAPAGIHPHAVFIAVENQAVKDGNVDLLRQLATSKRVDEATAAGQTLRILRERDQTSPVAQIQHVIDTRKQAFAQRTGQNAEAAVRAETGKLKASIKPPTKNEWQLFVDSITCR